MYAVFENTVSKTPEPPALLKFRASLGASAVADSVKSSGIASPPSSIVITLTSLRVGAISSF